MYTDVKASVRHQTEHLRNQAMHDRLHRAGYRDGERRPRYRQHWMNFASFRRLSARLRQR